MTTPSNHPWRGVRVLELGQVAAGPFTGSLIGVAALQASEYFGAGAMPRRLRSAHPRNAP